MTTIIKCQCDICRTKYATAEAAETCESKGVFDPKLLQPGLLFPWVHADEFVGIFSFGKVEPYSSNPHIGVASFLAFRANPNVGDSNHETGLCGMYFITSSDDPSKTAFEQFFGIGQNHWRGRWMNQIDLKMPECIRACKYFIARGIAPKYVNKDGKILNVIITREMIPDSYIVVQIPDGKYLIPYACRNCGSDIRPTMFQGRTFRGSNPIYCDQWKCDCGHVDKYKDIQMGYGIPVIPTLKTYFEDVTV